MLELEMLDLSKKDGKWNCTAEQCGTNQTKCITVPVVGDICWNITCPACGGDDKEVAGPAVLIEAELEKGKKKYGCKPADCGTTKDVCITVPVKGDVCWKVKCPACKAVDDDKPAELLEMLDPSKKDGKWNCTAEQCGTNQTKCITVPVVGDICWNITCPACGGDDKEVAGPAVLIEAELEKGKKKYGCKPADCGTTKDVCITVPVKGDVCWKVKCPACKAVDDDKPAELLEMLDLSKKDGKWNCTAEQCGTNQTKCITVPVVGDICWNITCPACGGDDKEVAGPAVLIEAELEKGKKKYYDCKPADCGTTKDVCITVPVKGDVCWKVKCPACKAEEEPADSFLSFV
eukprot:jgi/Tetstr1/461711/TSEL_000605.t1